MKTETAPETSEAVMDPLPYEAIRVVQLPILGSTFTSSLRAPLFSAILLPFRTTHVVQDNIFHPFAFRKVVV